MAGLDEGRTVIAVVGTGSMGMQHLQALAAMPDADVIGIPRRQRRADELTGRGFRTAESVERAAQLGATLAIIATETGRHVEDGLEALRCGLHVLVEKPVAPHCSEAVTLVRAATGVGRLLYVGCTLRFSESLNLFRSVLDEVGPLHSIRIEAQSYLPAWRPQRDCRSSYAARPDEGGVLRDLIHEIDYAGWLFGWPTSVWATLRNLGRLGIDAEETADLVWDAPSGGTVSLTLDYLSQPPRRRMSAYGAKGTLIWDGIEGTVTATSADGSSQRTASEQTRDEMILAQATAFKAACQGSVDPRLATAFDGLHALAVCDAARSASATRCEQPVEYLDYE